MADSSTANTKITLYWLNESRAQRIAWMLEECKGVDYKVEVFKRTAQKLAPPELKKIHPLGKAPVISIETPNQPAPLVLAESGNILEYLCDHFAPHLAPKQWQEGKQGQVGGETPQWLRYRFYMHYAEGSLMPVRLLQVIMKILSGPQIPFFVRPITRAVAGKIAEGFINPTDQTNLDFLESQLATSPDGGKYLCGKDLTAADILMSFPLMAGRANLSAKKHPKLVAYIDAFETHESYIRAVKHIEEVTGEPYAVTGL